MQTYALADHVHACAPGEQVILLDLKADRYLAVDLASARALAQLVRGWPQFSIPNSARDGPDEHAETLARKMCERGLLTADNATSLSSLAAAASKVDSPSIALIEEDLLSRPAADRRNVHDFAVAALTAAALLRRRTIYDVVTRIRRRKQAGRSPADLDFELARRLVAAFNALRPFFFTAKDGCLFHAVAMLEFLARYDLRPDWVFAVKTAPFVAHCWIQHGEVVFNDAPERVRAYTPIMVV